MIVLMILLGLLGINKPENAAYKVKIFISGEGDRQVWHHGSGAAIGEKLILTNCHVVAKAERNGFVYNAIDQKAIPVKCVGFDEDIDIAVLYVMDDTILDFVEMAEICPQEISIYGFNGEGNPDQLVTATGKVYAYTDTQFGTKNGVQVAKIQVDHGNSGSGVYNSEGKLAGLVFAKDRETGPGDVHFTPIEHIRRQFESWDIQCSGGGCNLGGSSSRTPNNPLRPAPIPDEDNEPQVAEDRPKPKPIPTPEPKPVPTPVEACKCDPSKLNEVEILAQNAKNEAEFARKELENQGKRLDDIDKNIREGALSSQNMVVLMQRIDDRVNGLEKKFSGQLKVRFSYDPKTNTLTPVK